MKLIKGLRTTTPRLHNLALACYNGACNIRGLLNELNGAYAAEIRPGLGMEKKSIDLKIILGQLSFLVGDSLGPSTEALEQFRKENNLL